MPCLFEMRDSSLIEGLSSKKATSPHALLLVPVAMPSCLLQRFGYQRSKKATSPHAMMPVAIQFDADHPKRLLHRMPAMTLVAGRLA
jgi:hypothetical protein